MGCLHGKGLWISTVTMVILIALLPLGLSKYALSLLMQIMIYSIFAMSFDLLLGYLGMLSFGHSAFWGLGVYVYAILTSKGYMANFWGCLGLVIFAGLVLALVIGILVMRTTGVYFAFVNFAFAMLLLNASFKWQSLTGGENGITNIPRPWGLDGLSFYYFVSLFFLVCFLLIHWLTHSKYGRTLIGIRENSMRMQALGYNIWLYKYSCFVFAGLFGTIAGFLFCSYNRFASPDDLGFMVSGMALLMVLIGGKASQIEAIIGAVIIIFLYHFISAYTEHWLLVVGVVFVLVVIFAKEGATGHAKKVWMHLSHGRSPQD